MSSARERKQMADEWEYCRITLSFIGGTWMAVNASANTGKTYSLQGHAVPIDSALESLGKEGWELVATFGDATAIPQLVFKRRKP